MCRRIKTVVRSPAFYCFNSNLQPLLGWAHKDFQFKFRPANDNEPIECWFLFFSFFFSLQFSSLRYLHPLRRGVESRAPRPRRVVHITVLHEYIPVLWHLQIKPQINRTILAYIYIHYYILNPPQFVYLDHERSPRR